MKKYILHPLEGLFHAASAILSAFPIDIKLPKNSINSPIFDIQGSIRHVLAILVVSGVFTCHGIAATIVADFTGGNSDTLVDAWTGAAGEGWAKKWNTSKNGTDTLFTGTTKSDVPLTPSGGNYLTSTLSNPGTGTPSAVVARQYENYETIDLAKEHTVSFEFRLDSSLSDLGRLMFFDGIKTSRDASDGDPTWMIRYDSTATNFTIYNGTTQQNTNVSLLSGNVYRFTIRINPAQKQYMVLIENLTNPGSKYESPDWLNFYTDKNSAGGYLNFAGRVVSGTGKEVTMSLDSIHITAAIPEPSSLTLIGLVIGGVWLIKRRHHL